MDAAQPSPDGPTSPGRPFWVANLLIGLFVFALAILFRVPSCWESFWLDELHSAWTVAEGFDMVAERSARGNQTRYYFQLLWCWQSLVGNGELALRMSSVLASSLAAAVLSFGVNDQTRRLPAGLIAGGILALDPNAVFFGTELRPYGLILLFAVLATWAFTRSLDERTGFGRADCKPNSGPRWRLLLIVCVCIAALVHPTSVGVLGWFLPATWIVLGLRRALPLTRWDVGAALVVATAVWLLGQSSLSESWARRDQWRAFALAKDFGQLSLAWHWIPLVAFPLAIGLVGCVFARIVKVTNRQHASSWNHNLFVNAIPLLVGVLGTLAFFLASYWEYVPLWHRRYYLAALPLIAWSAGHLATLVPARERWAKWMSVPIVVGILSFLIWYQGTWDALRTGTIPRQSRGESWREAVEFVQSKRSSTSLVWIDTGLIESQVFQSAYSTDADPVDQAYLTFPLRGPYRIDKPRAVSVIEHPTWTSKHRETIGDEEELWLLTRYRPSDLTDRYLQRTWPTSEIVLQKSWGAIRVTAIRIPNEP